MQTVLVFSFLYLLINVPSFSKEGCSKDFSQKTESGLSILFKIDTCGRGQSVFELSAPKGMTLLKVREAVVNHLNESQLPSSKLFRPSIIAKQISTIKDAEWYLSKYYKSFCFDEKPRRLRCENYLLGRRRGRGKLFRYRFSYNPGV